MCSTVGVWVAWLATSKIRKGRNSTAKPSRISYTIEIRRRPIAGVPMDRALFDIGGRAGGGHRGRDGHRLHIAGRRQRRRRGVGGSRRRGRGDRLSAGIRNDHAGFNRRHGLDLALARRRQVGDLFLGVGGCRQLLFLFFRQLLILFPLRRFFARVQFLGARVGLAHLAALFRRQLDELAHALVQALLLVRIHRRIAVGDLQPFFLAQAFHLVPLGGERLERLLLHRRQVFPQRFVERRLGGDDGVLAGGDDGRRAGRRRGRGTQRRTGDGCGGRRRRRLAGQRIADDRRNCQSCNSDAQFGPATQTRHPYCSLWLAR